MKSFVKYLVGTAGLVMSMSAMGNTADNGGYAPADAAPGSLLDNRGSVLCTAAINSTGVKAGGNTVAASTRLSLGTYQVTFKGPCTAVTAANGWARIVQVDTLTTGTLPSIKCITADRAGVPNADTDTHYSSKTFIEILDNSGKISRFEYDHKTKEALIKTVISRDKYSELSDVPQFWTTPAGMAEFVKRAVGDRQKDGFWEPNEIKAGIFCSRGLDNHCFEIKACPESPGKKIVEDKILSKKTQKPLIKTRLVVDSNDYSKVYEYHIENMNTGTEMMAEIRSNFDSHGFPHKVISKEYDKQGKLRLHLIYEFDNVQINPSFGVDTFEIESKGYTVIDQRKG